MAFQETFKALGDPTRRAILDLLKGGAKTAGEIGSQFDMTGATVSHHLSVLRRNPNRRQSNNRQMQPQK